jgi:hypothetical protein
VTIAGRTRRRGISTGQKVTVAVLATLCATVFATAAVVTLAKRTDAPASPPGVSTVNVPAVPGAAGSGQTDTITPGAKPALTSTTTTATTIAPNVTSAPSTPPATTAATTTSTPRPATTEPATTAPPTTTTTTTQPTTITLPLPTIP